MRLFSIPVLALLAAPLASAVTSPVEGRNVTRHVLIIGVDGLRSDALQAASTPAMDSLIANGAVTWNSYAGGDPDPAGASHQDTSSAPGWSSVLTGVWSDKHGASTFSEFWTADFAQYPHLFARVRAAFPNAYLASIVQWELINQIMLDPYPGRASYSEETINSSTAVRISGVNQLATQDPDVLYLHFGDVDRFGHQQTFNQASPGYIDAIERTDADVALLVQAINSRPNIANEDWLILITSDHGGRGTSHGGHSPSERRVWVIASGGDVVPGVISPGPGHIVIPVTIFRHLGIPVDPAWGLEPLAPFGYRMPEATRPKPEPAEFGLDLDLTLDWLGGDDGISYQVYMGTQPTLGPGELIGSPVATELSVSGLNEETKYYWRVDTVTAMGTTTGAVWEFTTRGHLLNHISLQLPFEGDAVNAVGVADDGTLVGNTSFVPGQLGDALSLNGAGGAVNLGTGADLQFGSDIDFTVSMWIKSNGWADDPVFIGNKNWNSEDNTGWIIAGDPDGVSWQWNMRGNSGETLNYDTIHPIADGSWHHICVSSDRDGLASFYTDGELNGRYRIIGQGDLFSGLPTVIGQDGTLSYPTSLPAEIDDVRIWHRQLGPAEVRSLVTGQDPVVGTRYCDGLPNTAGQGARILAMGSDLLLDNDLRLIGLNLPSNQAGIFFYGPTADYAPTAAGIRCIGAPLWRIQPGAFAGPSGTVEKQMDLTDYPFIGILQAGLTHRFQLWYRDPTSSIATSNFSDGLAIQFQ